MAFRMKGWSPFKQDIGSSDLDRYSEAHFEYSKGKKDNESRLQMLRRLKSKYAKPGDVKKNITLQGKWKKFAGKFGGKGADSTDHMDWTPEHRAQKNLDDSLYAAAQKDAQPQATTADVGAQGAHFERASRSKEYKDFVAKTKRRLEEKGYSSENIIQRG